MHAISNNQIADILRFNDNAFYKEYLFYEAPRYCVCLKSITLYDCLLHLASYRKPYDSFKPYDKYL